MDKMKMEFVLMVIAMGSATLLALAGMIVWAYRGRRTAKALPDQGVAQLSAQIESMQQQLDSMHVEIERVAEGQRFTTKLLSDRASAERIGG